MVKLVKGNDIWAIALLQNVEIREKRGLDRVSQDVQKVLDQFEGHSRCLIHYLLPESMTMPYPCCQDPFL